MDDLYVVVPANVTVSMVRDVLERAWTVEGRSTQPRIALEQITREFGGYPLIAVRYSDSALAQRWRVRSHPPSSPRSPMLLDADGTFLAPHEFLRKLDQEPPWEWFPRSAAGP